MFYEIIRHVIIVVVWVVLIVRSPFMVRDRQQRPLWSVLAVFAGGAIVIQSWFGAAINDLTGVPQFNNLVQGLWGVLNVAVTLEFAFHLVGGGTSAVRGKATRIACAISTMLGMALLFGITPASGRFRSTEVPWSFAAYALLAAVYMMVAAALAVWIIWSHLPRVHGRPVFVGLLMMSVGNATEIPFMVVQTLRRLTPHVTPELLQVGFLLNTTRFILVPLGCVVAAIEPLRKAALHYYRRVRLYSLWYLLRTSTTQLVLGPLVSRGRDMVTFDDSWERLHRRVIETRDSIFFLYDTWAWPELLEDASRHADAVARPARRRLVTIACWLEVTRRAAVIGAPELHRDLDAAQLPELLADESTVHVETRSLLRLHRAMRSRQVQTFADRVVEEALGTPVR